MDVEAKETKLLALRATIDSQKVIVGSELWPGVSIVNVSGKPLKVNYLKPTLMVPEIWNDVSKKREVNAPTYIFSQACAMQSRTMAPNEEIKLFALPIILADQKFPAISDGRVRGFWNAPLGQYPLKYSVDLEKFIPGKAGIIKANDLKISIVSAAKNN